MALQDAFEVVAGVGNKSGQVAEQLAPVAGSQLIAAQRDKINDERRQRYYKENQRDLFHYSQLAQKNAAKNEVEGLRKAGLSPALAGGANGMSVATASAPSGSTGALTPSPEAALIDYDCAMAESNLATGVAQRELLASEAALNDARTTGVNIDNDNKEGANKVANAAWTEIFNSAISDAKANGDTALAAIYEQLRDDGNYLHNVGSISEAAEIFKISRLPTDVIARRLEDYIDADVARYTRNHASTIEVARAMQPFWQNQLVKRQISELGALITKLNSEAEINKALLPSIGKKVEEIEANIRHTDVSSEVAKHNDLAQMIDAGDGVGIASYILTTTLSIVGQAFAMRMGAKALRPSHTTVNTSVDNSTVSTPKASSPPSPEVQAKLDAQKAKIEQQELQRRSRAQAQWRKEHR